MRRRRRALSARYRRLARSISRRAYNRPGTDKSFVHLVAEELIGYFASLRR